LLVVGVVGGVRREEDEEEGEEEGRCGSREGLIRV